MRVMSRRIGPVLICLLATALLTPIPLLSITLAQDASTVSSDKSIYKLGETVKFSLPSKLDPNQTYYLMISRKGETVHQIEITTDGEGNPVGEASWSTDSVEPGTYSYVLKTSSGGELGGGTLGVVGINKGVFAAEETIVVTGGGATGEVAAALRNDSSVIATGSAHPDEYGEFSLSIAIPYDTPNGTYSVVVEVSGAEIVFEVKIETTSSTLITNTELLIDELLSNTSGINASIVNSLVAKLKNAKMKVEAAEELLAEGRTHLARNTLRAARNMLSAFIHEVMAQRGKHLDEAAADGLIAAARQLIRRIDYLMSRLDSQTGIGAMTHMGKDNGRRDEEKGETKSGGKGKGKDNHGGGNNGDNRGKK
jgi:hypothetical protein